jgi:hypothetical protein
VGGPGRSGPLNVPPHALRYTGRDGKAVAAHAAHAGVSGAVAVCNRDNPRMSIGVGSGVLVARGDGDGIYSVYLRRAAGSGRTIGVLIDFGMPDLESLLDADEIPF